MLRRFRWILIVPVVLVVITLATIIFQPRGEVEEQLGALRAAGLPTSLQELDAWYAEVPASNNAALLIDATAGEHVAATGPLVGMRTPPAGEPVRDELAPALASYLEQNAAPLDKLHRAARLTQSKYPLDLTQGAALVLPRLAKIKGLAILLRYESIHHASQGNRDLALRSVISGFALCRTLRHEPFLITELVRIACVAITLESLEHLLAARPLTDAQLRTLGELLLLVEHDSNEGAYRALVGERALSIGNFTAGSNYLEQEIGENVLGSGGNPSLQTVAAGVHRLLGFRARDAREYLRFMGEFSVALTNRFPEALRLSRKVEADADGRMSRGLGRFAVLSRMVLPAISKLALKEAALITRLRCAHTALAIERYRLEHAGALPNSLEELVPQYLQALPRDPVEGDPLKIVPLAERGYRISSPLAGRVLQNQRTALFTVER